MKIFEVTQLNEDEELRRALVQAAERYITNRTNRNTAPNVDTSAPGQLGRQAADDERAFQSANGISDPAVQRGGPSRPERPNDPNAPEVDDSVARQGNAQAAWNEKYPADTFVQGLPAEYNQVVERLSGNLTPQNVQDLEDVVENDTPNEIVQVLYRRLTSAQGYPKEDLQDAVDQGTAGGFTQMEVDGATQLLDYLRRLEIRLNQ